jgi:hypothetical protein
MPDDLNVGIPPRMGLTPSPEVKSNFGFSDTGFDNDPQLKARNDLNNQVHIETYTPVVKSAMMALNPNATPDQRLQAAQVMNMAINPVPNKAMDALPPEDRPRPNVKTADEFRLTDLNAPSLLGIFKNLKGGADQAIPAFNDQGKRFIAIYNQRTSELNPKGEFRRFEDEHGNPLTEKQLQEAGNIASLADIPMDQQIFYKNNGVALKDVLTNQARDWVQKQNLKGFLAQNISYVRDNANREEELTKELAPYSQSPKVQAWIAGSHAIVRGNANENRKTEEMISRIANGTATNSEAKDFIDKNAGTVLGPYFANGSYKEGKQFTKADGKTLTSEDVNAMQKSFMQSQSSTQNIESRKEDLIKSAALYTSGLDQSVIDKMLEYANVQAIQGKIQNEAEKLGFNLQRPMPDFKEGDSYIFAGAKAKYNKLWSELADKYVNKVQNAEQQFGGKVPPIGAVDIDILRDPSISEARKITKQQIANFIASQKDVYKQINEQKDITPQMMGETQNAVKNTPVVPPANVTKPAIQNSAPPKAQNKTAKPVKKALTDIFGG